MLLKEKKRNHMTQRYNINNAGNCISLNIDSVIIIELEILYKQIICFFSHDLLLSFVHFQFHSENVRIMMPKLWKSIESNISRWFSLLAMYDETSEGQQREAFRDQDLPRVCNKSTANLLRELSRSTPSSPTTLQHAVSLEKCFSEPEFFQKQQELLSKREEQRRKEKADDRSVDESSVSSSSVCSTDESQPQRGTIVERSTENILREPSVKVPSLCKHANEVCVAFDTILYFSFISKETWSSFLSSNAMEIVKLLKNKLTKYRFTYQWINIKFLIIK